MVLEIKQRYRKIKRSAHAFGTYSVAFCSDSFINTIINQVMMTSSVWDFLIIFFILFAVLVVIVVTLVFRAKPKTEQVEDLIDVNQEKIIIKEIVKIRCRYCGFTYDQGLDSCPNCGART
jgi:hypothetical protein